MSQDFNPGSIDLLNAQARAEARAVERTLPRQRYGDPGRWPSISVARPLGLLLLAIVLGGWVLTLVNGR